MPGWLWSVLVGWGPVSLLVSLLICWAIRAADRSGRSGEDAPKEEWTPQG